MAEQPTTLAGTIAMLHEALDDMVWQFAHRSFNDKGRFLGTGGCSSLELAFDALGWDNPHYVEGVGCMAEGCPEWDTCGTPTTSGYMRVCGKHYEEIVAQRPPDNFVSGHKLIWTAETCCIARSKH
jgi:hypothetical protein